MLQRTASAVFLPGAFVFPGGALDPDDASERAARRVRGLDDAQASARLGIPSGGLAYWVAAARECFEESGILLARDEKDSPVDPDRAASLEHLREPLNAGTLLFSDFLEKENLFIPAQEIAYYSHWITAPGRPRRFSTRFFVACAPAGQHGAHDRSETVHSVWVSPREALERGQRKEIELIFPTRSTLTDLAHFTTPRAVLEHARSLGDIEADAACWALDHEGSQRLFRRTDAPYHEIHWSDPEEQGDTCFVIQPGIPKRLDRYVTRITAPNPGVMTGPGTNTYLVGGEDGELAVIDPGPAIDAHVAKILEAGAGRIRWILTTHTHLDHSPAAALLKAATGAQVWAAPRRRRKPGPELRAGPRARRRRPRGAGRLPLARDPYAGPRVEPPVLPAGRDEDAVHGRSRHAGLDGGDQSARRRHARLPRVAGAAAAPWTSPSSRPATAT